MKKIVSMDSKPFLKLAPDVPKEHSSCYNFLAWGLQFLQTSSLAKGIVQILALSMVEIGMYDAHQYDDPTSKEDIYSIRPFNSSVAVNSTSLLTESNEYDAIHSRLVACEDARDLGEAYLSAFEYTSLAITGVSLLTFFYYTIKACQSYRKDERLQRLVSAGGYIGRARELNAEKIKKRVKKPGIVGNASDFLRAPLENLGVFSTFNLLFSVIYIESLHHKDVIPSILEEQKALHECLNDNKETDSVMLYMLYANIAVFAMGLLKKLYIRHKEGGYRPTTIITRLNPGEVG